MGQVALRPSRPAGREDVGNLWESLKMRRASIATFVVLCIGSLAGVASPTSAASCAWTTASSPNPGSQHTQLVSIDGAGTDAWAVGTFKDKGVPYKTLAVRLSGDQWEVVRTANVARRRNALSAVTYVAPDEAWAVGGAGNKDGTSKNLIQLWDGTAWTKVPAPSYGRPAEALTGIDAVATSNGLPIDPLVGTEMWAVGATSTTSGKRAKAQMLHFDGTTWSKQALPGPGGPNVLISVLAFSPTDVWAAGYFRTGGDSKPYVVHYDGASWSIVTTPAPGVGLGGSVIWAIDGTSSEDLWGVGFQSTGLPLVLHYDGDAWSSAVGLPVIESGILSSVTVDADGEVHAAGFHVAQRSLKTLMLRGRETWTKERTPSPAFINILQDVSALPGGSIWSAGYKTNERGVSKALVLRCG